MRVGEQPLWINLIDPEKPAVRDRFQVPIERSTSATALRFDAGGGELVIGLADGRIVLCDYAHHRVRMTLTGHSRSITAIADIPDGKRWVSAAEDGLVMVWEPGQERPAQVLRPVSGYATMLWLDSRGELLLIGCWDGTVELWDWQQGRLLVSIALLDALRWVAATPEGLFDGSDGAWETLRWRFGNDTFQTAPVEQFFNEYFYPGVVGAILAGQRPVPRAVVGDIDRHASEVRMDVAAAPGQAGFADVRLGLREGLPHGGVRDVRLFRNGILVHAWRGQIATGTGGTAELTYRVPLGAGENRLEAYAFNNANIKSLTAHGRARGPATASQRIAYLLAIGVNQYADSNYNLEYARADAEEFLHQVRTHQTGLDQFDRIEEKLLPDREATHENIQSALADLARKAHPDDAILIFYAGHGVASKGRFYLLPHDADFSAMGEPQRGISDEELSNLLEPVNAGHIVLVLDTCQSASTLENPEWRRGPLNSRGLAQLAYEKGMYLLAAAQSDGVAKERRDFGHGLLSYALLTEGLDPSFSDVAPHDGLVTVSEWLSYAGHRVPQLDAESQLTGRGVKVPRARSQPVQQPRVYYRREWVTPALIVAREGGRQ